MKYNVLTAHPSAELARKIEFDCAGDFKPRFSRSHSRGHIRRAYARGKRTERTVCTGVAVRADNAVARYHKTLFGKQRVLYANIAHVVEVVDIVFFREAAALLALNGGLDILVGCEVIHYK